MRFRHPIACGLAALSLALAAGCGEEEVNKADEETTAEPAESTPAEASPPPAATAEARAKPKIAKPQGPPPKKLVVKDLAKGKGTPAKAGDQLQVNYVGVNYRDGKEFDSSFSAGKPFDFPLGGGMVIPGWDQGLEGMKVGGRRMLTIPPDLAYGPEGQPPTIAPNATLVFVIDLLGKS